jgi:U3 small nucleolar RNA-associated protein 12
MVKAYLRYEQADAWGVITSASNVVFDRSGSTLAAASLEAVALWSVRRAALERRLVPPPAASGAAPGEVTALAASPAAAQLAAGHADGTVRVWDLATGECLATFAGHRSAVTALAFSPTGATLASGARDTDVVLWDVVAEAGLFRLRGHRGQVTALAFLGGAGAGRLASASKDELVKVWDLDTQHCCQTLAPAAGELWALAVDSARARLAVAGAGAEVRLFRVDADAAGGDAGGALAPAGALRRAAPGERAATLAFGADGAGRELLACQGAGKVTEVWRLRPPAEAARRARRRLRRRREKRRKDGAGGGAAAEDDSDAEEGDEVQAGDEFELIATVRCKHKVRAAALAPPAPGGAAARRGRARLVLSLANNSLEAWDLDGDAPAPAAAGGAAAAAAADAPARAPGAPGAATGGAVRAAVVDGPGHRSDVRALALAPNDALALSAAAGSVKIWDPRTGGLLRTVESGYGLCAFFAPGGRHAVVGTKEGTLEVVDAAAGARLAVVAAHEGPVWAAAPLAGGAGFATGGADKEVKFWEWEAVEDGAEEGGEGGSAAAAGAAEAAAARPLQGGPRRRLGIALARTLRMTDDVLALAPTPDGRLLAVALLDATVRVFHADSLKFHLSLYGHSLPVLAMAASSDSALLATGSADKSLKLWGLDFGDCHRSLRAHADSVTAVAWVPGTHYLFTASKDRAVKYWDADRFEHLLTLDGHHGEVWALAASSLGDFALSAGHDRSLRRWERSSEPFFVEEEKERRLESLFEAELEAGDGARALGGEGEGEGEGGGGGGGGATAGRRTAEAVSAADAIVEALELAAGEEERVAEHAEEASRRRRHAAERGRDPDADSAAAPPPLPPPNPMLLGAAPAEHVLAAVARVRGAELEQALLLLPFGDALRLLRYVAGALADGGGGRVETLARAAALLLRLHMAQLSAAPAARGVLTELRGLLRGRVQALKDVAGFNLAALGHLQRAARARGAAPTPAPAPAAKKPRVAAGGGRR